MVTPAPKGDPEFCPICGGRMSHEPLRLAEHSLCPPCGKLLSLFRDGWGGRLGVDARYIRPETRLREMGIDSLDTVSLVMEVEEVFDVDITDEAARSLLTVADLLRWIRRRQIERSDQK